MAKEKSRGNREKKKPKATAKVVSPTTLTTSERITAKTPAGKSGSK